MSKLANEIIPTYEEIEMQTYYNDKLNSDTLDNL
jgi:hypothetical protein